MGERKPDKNRGTVGGAKSQGANMKCSGNTSGSGTGKKMLQAGEKTIQTG